MSHIPNGDQEFVLLAKHEVHQKVTLIKICFSSLKLSLTKSVERYVMGLEDNMES